MLPEWPLALDIALFLLAAGVIALGGARMAKLADQLADRTKLGEALVGALFLGVSTSLPGIAASVTAAIDGLAAMAVSNTTGGIAVQTAFLAVADMFYRKANLEHAAASVTNLVHAALLLALLATLLLLMTGPDWHLGHVHFGTPLLFLLYGFGLHLAFRSSAQPMWSPKLTGTTIADQPDSTSAELNLARLWLGFLTAAAVVFVAGVTIARLAGSIVRETGFSESAMGGLFVAVSTSLPELVTTVAAVRRGAVTLAVSDIVGGNAFDVLFVCVADLFFLEGSIYHAISRRELFLAALAILLNVVLLLGLIHRERRGPGGIGFESVFILVLYVTGWCFLAFGM